MKTKTEARAKARTFYRKALHYAEAARANRAAGHHDPAVSNAIHAVINLVDAICIESSGVRSTGTDHGYALKLLARMDMDTKVRDILGKRLANLLSVKNIAEYDGTLISASQSAAAIKDLDRALKAIKPLAQGSGWE